LGEFLNQLILHRSYLFFIIVCFVLPLGLQGGVVEDIVELKDLGLDDESLLLAAKEGKMSFGKKDFSQLIAKGFSEEFIGLLRSHTDSLKKNSQGLLLMVEAVGKEDPISLKVISDKPDALLLLDGKVVDRFEGGALKLGTSPGWHEVGLRWKGGEFSREIRLSEEERQTLHVFAKVPLDEESREMAQSLLEKKLSREVKAFCERDFSRSIKDRFGGVKGREFFRKVKVLPTHGIKTLDETRVRMQFQGYAQKEMANGPILMSPSLSIFFILDFNSDGEVISKQINEPRIYREYMNIIKEVEELDEDYKRIRSFNGSKDSKRLNLKIIASPKSTKDTKAFHLSLPHSQSIYTLGLGAWSICPLERPYQTRWERKGVDPKSELNLNEGTRFLVVLHSNWLGDKSQIFKVPEGVELDVLNYENHKEKLEL